LPPLAVFVGRAVLRQHATYRSVRRGSAPDRPSQCRDRRRSSVASRRGSHLGPPVQGQTTPNAPQRCVLAARPGRAHAREGHPAPGGAAAKGTRRMEALSRRARGARRRRRATLLRSIRCRSSRNGGSGGPPEDTPRGACTRTAAAHWRWSGGPQPCSWPRSFAPVHVSTRHAVDDSTPIIDSGGRRVIGASLHSARSSVAASMQ